MPERLLSAAACAEIAARAEKATAGPWWYECVDEGDDEVGSDPQGYIHATAQGDDVLTAMHTTDGDGAFIAAAREDIPALLRTVNALREALEPFAKQRKHSGFSGPTYRIMRVDWERAVTVYDSTAAGQNQTSDTASVQEIEDPR